MHARLVVGALHQPLGPEALFSLCLSSVDQCQVGPPPSAARPLNPTGPSRLAGSDLHQQGRGCHLLLRGGEQRQPVLPHLGPEEGAAARPALARTARGLNASGKASCSLLDPVLLSPLPSQVKKLDSAIAIRMQLAVAVAQQRYEDAVSLSKMIAAMTGHDEGSGLLILQMEQAVREERYDDAAKLRDMLAKMNVEVQD